MARLRVGAAVLIHYVCSAHEHAFCQRPSSALRRDPQGRHRPAALRIPPHGTGLIGSAGRGARPAPVRRAVRFRGHAGAATRRSSVVGLSFFIDRNGDGGTRAGPCHVRFRRRFAAQRRAMMLLCALAFIGAAPATASAWGPRCTCTMNGVGAAARRVGTRCAAARAERSCAFAVALCTEPRRRRPGAREREGGSRGAATNRVGLTLGTAARPAPRASRTARLLLRCTSARKRASHAAAWPRRPLPRVRPPHGHCASVRTGGRVEGASWRRLLMSIDRIHATRDRIHCPPGETHSIADRIHSIADRIHCPPGEIHVTSCCMLPIADRIHRPPGETHPIGDGFNTIARRVNAIGDRFHSRS